MLSWPGGGKELWLAMPLFYLAGIFFIVSMNSSSTEGMMYSTLFILIFIPLFLYFFINRKYGTHYSWSDGLFTIIPLHVFFVTITFLIFSVQYGSLFQTNALWILSIVISAVGLGIASLRGGFTLGYTYRSWDKNFLTFEQKIERFDDKKPKGGGENAKSHEELAANHYKHARKMANYLFEDQYWAREIEINWSSLSIGKDEIEQYFINKLFPYAKLNQTGEYENLGITGAIPSPKALFATCLQNIGQYLKEQKQQNPDQHFSPEQYLRIKNRVRVYLASLREYFNADYKYKNGSDVTILQDVFKNGLSQLELLGDEKEKEDGKYTLHQMYLTKHADEFGEYQTQFLNGKYMEKEKFSKNHVQMYAYYRFFIEGQLPTALEESNCEMLKQSLRENVQRLFRIDVPKFKDYSRQKKNQDESEQQTT
jgi:hypothetical protein